MRISQDGYKTDMGQEGDAIPLGIQQSNDFTQFTMDVWNDKIFYQEKEFPAGFMAMSILNIPEEELPELIQAGGAPAFLFPVVVQGSDEEAVAVFPQLWRYSRSCGGIPAAAGTDIVSDRTALEVSALLLQ